MKFIHTSDLHLGKTYRNSRGAAERYEDFFSMLGQIVTHSLQEKVDFFLIGGDLFHTGQILPRTFARTIETLHPLKEAGIPCVAVEGNHDWIHRRDSISWMEALAQMGYLALLRPQRQPDGTFLFQEFDAELGCGGHLRLGEVNLYGVGYLGSQAGHQVPRICQAVDTERNILLFHVGIWTYSPVEIGNMTPEESSPLADVFDYVALGHGHKPYQVKTAEGRPYAFNPGSPECVNFGEEAYDKGFYLVSASDDGVLNAEFIPTRPRPMHSLKISLDGTNHIDAALERLQEYLTAREDLAAAPRPLLHLKLQGKVGFHPFEMNRERIEQLLMPLFDPLHIEISNQLQLAETAGETDERLTLSLEQIEEDVLTQLIGNASDFKDQASPLARLAMQLRDGVVQGLDEDSLLSLLANHSSRGESK